MDEVNEEENREQISLMDEVNEEENAEQVKFELLKTSENIEDPKCVSNDLKTSSSNEIYSNNQDNFKIKQFTNTQKLPLPNIKNLRKWINNDKKVS